MLRFESESLSPTMVHLGIVNASPSLFAKSGSGSTARDVYKTDSATVEDAPIRASQGERFR